MTYNVFSGTLNPTQSLNLTTTKPPYLFFLLAALDLHLSSFSLDHERHPCCV